MFRLVNNYLDPGGVFLFDFNTVYKYREVLGERTIAESREECSFIWDNYYYEEEHINEYELNLFVKETEGLYRKYTEEHYQRGYELAQIKAYLEDAGLIFEEAFDAYTYDAPGQESERIFVIARESGKH